MEPETKTDNNVPHNQTSKSNQNEIERMELETQQLLHLQRLEQSGNNIKDSILKEKVRLKYEQLRDMNL